MFYIFTPQDRAALIANLREIFGNSVSEKELKKIARKNYHNFAICFVDFLRSSKFKKEDLKKVIKELKGKEIFDKALEKNKGVILLTAHIGNWEIGASLFNLQGYNFTIVTMPERKAEVHNLLKEFREGQGVNVVTVGTSELAALEIIRMLRRNHIVAMLADRSFGSELVPVEFFGKPCLFPSGPVLLAMKTSAPLIPAFILLNEDGTYSTHVESPIEIDPKDRGEDMVSKNLRKVVAIIEKYAKMYPEQFFNFYYMWNNR